MNWLQKISISKNKLSIEEANSIGEQVGIDWNASPFSLEEFHKGMLVEIEHGSHDPETDVTNNDPVLTGKITWAHLKELPDYYTRLDKMEGSS